MGVNVAGSSLSELCMIDDYIAADVTTNPHAPKLAWRPAGTQHADGARVVWQQLYRELESMQEALLAAAQTVLAAQRGMSLGQRLLFEAERAYKALEGSKDYWRGEVWSLRETIRQLDLVWERYPTSGYLGSTLYREGCPPTVTSGQEVNLWDLYPADPAAMKLRGGVESKRWGDRERYRDNVLTPHNIARREGGGEEGTEALCKRVRASMTMESFTSTFDEGGADAGGLMDRALFGAKFHSSDIMGAPLALLRLTQHEIDMLWDAVSSSGKTTVNFGDVACFLSPSEEQRRYYWRDKILRGERRCGMAGQSESHVPSLSGHGNPLPILSPHQRRHGSKAEGSGRRTARVGGTTPDGAWGVLIGGLGEISRVKLGLPWKVDVDGAVGSTVQLAAGGIASLPHSSLLPPPSSLLPLLPPPD